VAAMSVLMPHVLRSVMMRTRDGAVFNLSHRYTSTAVTATETAPAPAVKVEAAAAPEAMTLTERLGDKYIPETAGRWKYVPADFKEFPERDLVNYPHPNFLEFHSPVRMGFIPDSWFKFFYEKTGETGGYMFIGSMGTFLFQKELVVVTNELYRMVPVGIHAVFWYFVASHLIGNMVHADADARYDMKYNWKQRQLQAVHNGMDDETVKQSQTQGIMQYLFEAKRENVGLQLEGAYRQRVNTLHQQVKRQLDFLVEYESTKRRFELGHMASWISKEVRKGITPALEEAALKKCVVDLQALAKKN
jgi:F-type H+-transporting ATPase subunit b